MAQHPRRQGEFGPVLSAACGLTPCGGNEALELVKIQIIFNIQHEKVPRVGASMATNRSHRPARGGCRTQQSWGGGEGWRELIHRLVFGPSDIVTLSF